MKWIGKQTVLVVLVLSMILGCTVVPTRSESSSSNSEQSSDFSLGSFVLGTLVIVGSIFLGGDDDDDCKEKDKDDGITINFN